MYGKFDGEIRYTDRIIYSFTFVAMEGAIELILEMMMKWSITHSFSGRHALHGQFKKNVPWYLMCRIENEHLSITK